MMIKAKDKCAQWRSYLERHEKGYQGDQTDNAAAPPGIAESEYDPASGKPTIVEEKEP